MDIKSITALVFFAILIEGMIEYVKLSFQKKMCIEIVVAMVIGIAISLLYHLDLLATVGISTDIPYVSNVLTGIILSRGSNYVWDLIGHLTEIEKTAKELTEEQKENMEIARPDEPNADEVVHEKSGGLG